MLIVFPWPPRELNPNSNTHWRKKSGIKITYREVCRQQVPAVRLQMGRTYGIKIKFYPPRAVGDIDNMLASIKPLLDALADQLGINDKQFRPWHLDIPGKSTVNPRVEIILYDGKNPLVISDKLS